MSSRTKNENFKMKRNKLKVASILDKFSYECFKHEMQLISLDINDWENIIISKKPKMLLVESAWEGNNGKWTNKIANINTTNDKTLENLVCTCRKYNIPTVFWNKEDPLFFSYFIESAKLFDYVFTTEEACIEEYKKIIGHNNIYVLPFAAQPKIHNPINRGRISLGKVAFAGTWYKKFPERIKDMKMILKPAFKYNLHIYDRMHHCTKDDNYKFPTTYQSYIKGSLSYEQMIRTYKKYDVFLNVNLVKNSLTMFSRRIFELLASGINVISSYSQGIERMLPGIVKLCKSEEDVNKYLDILLNNKELRERLSIIGQREVFYKHTYEHRIETILEKAGLSYEKKEIPGISIITCTNRIDNIEKIFNNFQRQNYKKKELIIILNNNSMNLKQLENQAKSYNNVKVFQLDERKSLGKCLNFAIKHTSYGYISKFDDDNYYAPEFLGDLMNAFKYTNADVVGKYTYYAYLEGSNTLVVRFPNLENRYVDFLCGSAFIMKKKVWEEIKFTDTTVKTMAIFSKDCVSRGIRLYSTDRFNYVYSKQHSMNEYICEIDDDEFLRKCNIVMYTKNYVPHITV
ncbi:glycosyltransferase family protein [Crassaminicella profunda]|uniref:glycosyltransferase family protein n=1 Tax=Crassaminicella profunda TaxID=1286698 RepID=UPI001CA689DA|nr:glycosyltransferase [Crassaminicella profunda]QZY57027.1 glycosyltransferase [Crassaminicella profunda]